MKKRILALMLALAMVFSSIPVLVSADDTYAVNSNIVGKASNPLTVKYDNSDGVKYTSLGDSIAYGFGLDNFTFDKLFMSLDETGGVNYRYGTTLPHSYPSLIRNYFTSKRGNDNYFKQRALCIARMDDLCTLIDSEKYPGDDYYIGLVKGLMLAGVYNSENMDDAIKADFGGAVEASDFITVTAGGNNYFGFFVIAEVMGQSGALKGDLSKYFGESGEKAFSVYKNTILVQAKLLDKLTGKATYEEKVEQVFTYLEKFLYTTAAYIKNTPQLLDLIHEKNPDAKVALTGLPDIFGEYDIKVGSIVIDLESIVVPMISILNNVLKNAAQSRSSYVRYIDISDVELIAPTYTKNYPNEQTMFGEHTGEAFMTDWDGHTIDSQYLLDFLLLNLDISHPSEKGHKQIADRIMENFKFVKEGTPTINIIGTIKNLWTSLLSLSGVTKAKNLLESLSKINIFGILKLDWK